MCPSIAVMAGGAGSGGGSGGSGDQGDGGASGNGDGSGENAEGDGSSAAAGEGECPGGTPCPSHASGGGGASAGDPVDIVTGRVFTLPVTDLHLPGRLPFHFTRHYSSSKPRRDVGFGPGWSHSLAWEVEVRRDSLRFWKDDGTYLRFSHLDKVGASAIGQSGWRLTRTLRGYESDLDGVTFAMEREAADGSAWRLTSIRDRNQASITVDADDRGLLGVTDSVGRKVAFERDAAGRATGLNVLLPSGARETFARYERDDRGRLSCVLNVLGDRWSYAYDDADRLISHRDPTGLTFHYVYDTEGRCVETWADREGRMPSGIMPDHPRRLADGTAVKGILHVKLAFGADGFSEVTTSEMSRRYFGNEHGKLDKEVHAGPPTTREYDDLGLVTRVLDGDGLESTLERDRRGRVLRATDRLGRRRILERAPTGEVLREVDPNGATFTRTYDAFGNMLTEVAPGGAIWSYRYVDGRLVTVMLPNGGSLHSKWDDHANLIEVTEPDGAVWRSAYDYFGRLTSTTSPLGIVHELVLDRAGRIVEERHDGVTMERATHDALDRVIDRTYPDGAVYRYEYGASDRLIRSTLPDGGVVRIEHDLENRPRRIFNQRGEVHEFVLSPKGQLEAERYFDGRETKLRYDNAGQLRRSDTGPRRRTEFVNDPEGRLVSRTFDGEVTHAFTYDAMDRVLSTTAPGVKVLLDRDMAGRVVRESFDVMGHSWSVETTYDAMGQPIRQTVGDLVDLRWTRDAAERASRYELAGAGVVEVARDKMGRMTDATLPGGAVWRRSWNSFDRLASQSVEDAAGGRTAETSFRYDVVQLLRERQDREAPSRHFDYDLLQQLVSVRAGTHQEDYAHDATANVFGGLPGASSRRYGRGDRLEEVGGFRIRHDDEGRIVSREAPGGGRWEYQYRSDGMLGRVISPDKVITESVYDVSARRVLRTIWKNGRRLRTTGYVWSGELMIAELELDGTTTRRVRTYLHHDDDDLVLAHHDREGERTAWRFYLSEPGGMPTRLVDERGQVIERIEAQAFGTINHPPRDTELRFPGQIADVEGGLSYNRHRFYDAGLGRYLTPDPAGLWEGLNFYRYVGNTPTALSDEDGLGCRVTIRGGRTRVSATSSGGDDYRAPTPGGSVATAVRNTPRYQPSRAPWPPGACAEAAAIDRYLVAARRDPANAGLGDRALLRQIPRGGIDIRHHDNPSEGNRRSPCPNCRQMLLELGIHPETDPRIAGNPRSSRARPLTSGRRGRALRS